MSAWTAIQLETVRQSAGRESAESIGRRLGKSRQAVQDQISALGLPAYRYQRRAWTRRDWLLHDAAGLSQRA